MKKSSLVFRVSGAFEGWFRPVLIVFYPPGSPPPAHPDPLSYAFGFGCYVPCCFWVCRQPTTSGLYRVRISSEHTAKVRNDSERIPSGQIDLVALARSPEDLLESLRAAKARYGAPAAAAIERS